MKRVVDFRDIDFVFMSGLPHRGAEYNVRSIHDRAGRTWNDYYSTVLSELKEHYLSESKQYQSSQLYAQTWQDGEQTKGYLEIKYRGGGAAREASGQFYFEYSNELKISSIMVLYLALYRINRWVTGESPTIKHQTEVRDSANWERELNTSYDGIWGNEKMFPLYASEINKFSDHVFRSSSESGELSFPKFELRLKPDFFFEANSEKFSKLFGEVGIYCHYFDIQLLELFIEKTRGDSYHYKLYLNPPMKYERNMFENDPEYVSAVLDSKPGEILHNPIKWTEYAAEKKSRANLDALEKVSQVETNRDSFDEKMSREKYLDWQQLMKERVFK